MQGGPAQPQQESGRSESPPAAEWYAVTGDRASALRIAPGLTVGESATGALALNDPDPQNQWIEFHLGDGGEPSVAVVTREKSLVADGTSCMRHRLSVGATIRLPNNTLYVSRDPGMPAVSGPVLEVVPRAVPGRPQDLVAPGWEEALRAVRGAPDEPAMPAEAELDAAHTAGTDGTGYADYPDRDYAKRDYANRDYTDDPTVPADAEAPDIPVTVKEPIAAGQRRKPGRSRQRKPVVLYLAMGTLALAGGVGVLVWTGVLESGGLADPRAVLERLERLRAPPVPAGDPDAASPSGDLPAQVTQTQPDATAVAPAPADPRSAERSAAERPEMAVQDESTQAPAAEASATEPPGAEGPAVELPAAETPVAQAPAAEAPATRLPADESPAPGATEPVETEPPPVASREGTGQPPPAEPDLDWRLVRARELLDSGYITFPPEDNAVAYVRRVLAQDPDNAQALELLGEASSRLIEAAVRAHDQGLDYEARNSLEEVLGFNPDHERSNQLWREWVGSPR